MVDFEIIFASLELFMVAGMSRGPASTSEYPTPLLYCVYGYTSRMPKILVLLKNFLGVLCMTSEY